MGRMSILIRMGSVSHSVNIWIGPMIKNRSTWDKMPHYMFIALPKIQMYKYESDMLSRSYMHT